MKNVMLRVHKVHRKHNGGHTVGMLIEDVKENGMKLTKYASVKFAKRPKVGDTFKYKRIVLERNKEGFDWITVAE